MGDYIFYFLAFLSIISALMVVFSKNPMYSVLYLVLCFFSIAGHYILLSAEFLAFVHIIVYAGAIMVLFLFVLMLLNLNSKTESFKTPLWKFAAICSGSALMLVILASFKETQNFITPGSPPATTIGTVKNLGTILFNEYILPFEISSVLFISAMVGAVILAKKELD